MFPSYRSKMSWDRKLYKNLGFKKYMNLRRLQRKMIREGYDREKVERAVSHEDLRKLIINKLDSLEDPNAVTSE